MEQSSNPERSLRSVEFELSKRSTYISSLLQCLVGLLGKHEHAFWHRYQDTVDNNLTYWGLDYPPLSAFQVSRSRPCHAPHIGFSQLVEGVRNESQSGLV